MPVACEGKNLWNGKRNPVTLVNTIEAKKRSEEHTSELQSRLHLVCRLLLEKKKINKEKPIPNKADIDTTIPNICLYLTSQKVREPIHTSAPAYTKIESYRRLRITLATASSA